jgi:uncharacterized protein
LQVSWAFSFAQGFLHFSLSLLLKRWFELHRHIDPNERHTETATQNRGLKMIWDTIETAANDISAVSASAEACLALGMKYCIGHGVSANNVEAHKWFNLAAMKGSEKAKSYRLELAREMSASEVAEAQRQARALLTLH